MSSEREKNFGVKKLNHLKNEKSPYLLQHTNNPVDWYPWGDEAFKKAKSENKPVFLSIGYSTCHWCHVMAHESFEDSEIGELMNQIFVSIKVDREERPDVDSIYMTACQMMTGTGGWPLTIVMTPDKKPFFAGTYFPKESGLKGVGLRDLILNIRDLWENKHGDIIDSSEDITHSLEQISHTETGDPIGEEVLIDTYQTLLENFDKINGGFGSYQKFPTPHHLLFLLRHWKRTGQEEALEMVEKTLQKMCMGGIYDQLGFGFHRYSVEPRWIVPHFEKMLYDQALLVMAYTEAYQATGKIQYRETAEEIVEYILRDMKSSEGGFYSAEDADSEGEEGKFYLWTLDEIMELLGSEDGKLFSEVYMIQASGNFKDESTGKNNGKNIIHREKTWDELSAKLDMKPETLWWKMENARETLYNARKGRIHPQKDDKILTDWNGLVIAALALSGRVFNRKDYVLAAQEAYDFIKTQLYSDNQLLHRYRDGEAAVDGNLDDYSYLIWGLIELYQATFQPRYLKEALKLNNTLIENFWDSENTGFYFTSKLAPHVLVRQKEAYDTALPSGNSVQMFNLERLFLLTGNEKIQDTSLALEKYFSPVIIRSPSAFTMFLCGVALKLGPSYEIVVIGDENIPLALINELARDYLPEIVLIGKEDQDNSLDLINESLKQKKMIDDKTTVYICGNGTCYPPVNNLDDIKKIIMPK